MIHLYVDDIMEESVGFKHPSATRAWAIKTADRLRSSSALGVRLKEPLPGACGGHGCVFDTDKRALLVKITDDADEAAAAHHFMPLQRSGWLRDVVRIRSVHAIPADRPAWMIVRERVKTAGLPLPQESLLYELNMELVRADEAGITPLDPQAMRLWPLLLADSRLVPVARLRIELHQLGLVALDLFGNNLGRRVFRMKGWPSPPSLVLLDTGGIISEGGLPLSPSRIPKLRDGAANRASCPGQDALEAEFKRLLGRDDGGGHCEIVSDRALHKVARRHGWNTPQGIVGFHTPGDKIYVSEPWSIPHELGHRYGLTDDHMGRWLCEALTEFVAEEAAKNTGRPHQVTYSYERSVVTNHLVPATGKGPLELARTAALADRPDRAIAELMRTDPHWNKVPRKDLVRALGKGRGDEPRLFLNLAP